MVKNNFIFVLFSLMCLLLSTSLVYSEDVIQYSNRINVKIDINGIVYISNPYKMEDLNIKLDYFPRERESQVVKDVDILLFNYLKNKKLTYSDDEVLDFYMTSGFSEEVNYGISSEVQSDFNFIPVNNKIEFPILNLNKDVRKFLLPTESIDSDDKEVMKQAHILAENEDDLFVLVAKIGQWVNKNIKYDLTTRNVEASISASKVLRSRDGVCDELTNLFIAMLRSLGIPARFVSGVAYTNVDYVDDNWGGHGWSEVYFPKYGWVPFDVTYGQYGYVDATHFVLNVGRDSNSEENTFLWRHNGAEVGVSELDVKTKLISQTGNFDGFDFNVKMIPIADQIGFNSYQALEIEIDNNNGYYVAPTLYLNKVEGVDIIKNEKINIILKPYETKKVYSLVKMVGPFNDGFIYTMPFSIQSEFSTLDNIEFTVVNSYKDYSKKDFDYLFLIEDNLNELNIDANCNYDKPIFVNQEFDVNCNFTNNEDLKIEQGTVCLGERCQEINLNKRETKELIFKYNAKETGVNILPLKISIGNSYKNTVVNLLVDDKPNISLSFNGLPSSIEYEGILKAKLILNKESYSNPKNITMTIYHPNFNKTFSISELKSEKEITFGLNGFFFDSGNNNIEFRLSYNDEYGTEYKFTKIHKIELKDLSIWQLIMVKLREWTR